jgi:hypothetical protein
VALNAKAAEAMGTTAGRHTSVELVAPFIDIAIDQLRVKAIHVSAENLSAHKSTTVKEFQRGHFKVHLLFTPTYSSWRNQFELWFGKIERDAIAPGVFAYVPRPQENGNALHSPLQLVASTREVGIRRSVAPHRYTASSYRLLARELIGDGRRPSDRLHAKSAPQVSRDWFLKEGKAQPR